jgi:signal transduction histidine kinase
MTIDGLIVVIAIIGNSFLSLFTLLKNPKSATNRLFVFFTLTLIFYLFFNYQLSIQTNNVAAFFWVKLVMSIAAIINLAFFLFAYTFPRSKFKPRLWKLFILIFWTISIILLAQFNFIFTSAQAISSGAGTPGLGMPFFLLHTLIFLGGGFFILVKNYRKATGSEKIQIRFILLGAIIMFCAILIFNFLFVILFKFAALVGFLPLYILFFVGFISYAIVRHRFLDIRLIVARAVAYIFLMLFIGLGYIGFLFNIAVLINKEKPTRETLKELIIPALIALLFAVTFQPLRRYIEKITDKIFYKDHYDANSLLWELSRIMASTLDLSEICKKILDRLLAAMRVSYGSVVLLRKSSIIWVGGAGKTSGAPFKGNDIYHLIHESYKPHAGNEQVLIYEELTEGKLKNIMREHAITLVLPLIVREELIGGILLGEKSSGEIYSSEDIDLLKILTPEVAVAVKNSLSFEEIKRFNITLEEEVKHATERLRNANHKLKELDSLKDEFVSIASHELRTPMTAIKSYLWMSLNQPGQPIKEPLKKYLNISYSSTERLIRLVNDMLTVSRIERNKIELKLAPVDVFEVAKAVFDELKITADERKIKLTLNRADEKPFTVNGDREKLREVFQNIVGNALKFTPADGSIKIEMARQGNSVKTAITDTGPGIQKESMNLLFKKFSKIEYSYAKHSNQPGTGLGLYISKQIVSLHNGDIQVQSEVNVGTTFTVVLPGIKISPEVKKD